MPASKSIFGQGEDHGTPTMRPAVLLVQETDGAFTRFHVLFNVDLSQHLSQRSRRARACVAFLFTSPFEFLPRGSSGHVVIPLQILLHPRHLTVPFLL